MATTRAIRFICRCPPPSVQWSPSHQRSDSLSPSPGAIPFPPCSDCSPTAVSTPPRPSGRGEETEGDREPNVEAAYDEQGKGTCLSPSSALLLIPSRVTRLAPPCTDAEHRASRTERPQMYLTYRNIALRAFQSKPQPTFARHVQAAVASVRVRQGLGDVKGGFRADRLQVRLRRERTSC